MLVPGAAHAGKDTGGEAIEAARELLSGRGKGPRQHQNMLAFLAPDRGVTEGPAQEARRFLAWRSVVRDREALNLDAHQRREAADGEKASDERCAGRDMSVITDEVVKHHRAAGRGRGSLRGNLGHRRGRGEHRCPAYRQREPQGAQVPVK